MKRLKKFSGAWVVPFTEERARQLQDIVNWIEIGGLRDIVDEKLYDVYGSDELFDSIEDLIDDISDKLSNLIRTEVLGLLSDYDDEPEGFQEKLEPEAKEILEKLVR